MLMLSMYSSYGDLLPSKDFVTIFFLLVFIITSTFGFLTIPFTMLPELFPIHVRGITAGFSVSFAYLSSFVAIKLYPTMVLTMGSGTVFLIYGVISIFGTFFAYYILPETKGKTLQEIENLFKSRSNKYDDSETRLWEKIEKSLFCYILKFSLSVIFYPKYIIYINNMSYFSFVFLF